MVLILSTGDMMMRFWTLHLTPQASISQLPQLMVNFPPSFPLPSPLSPLPSPLSHHLPLPPIKIPHSPLSPAGTAQVFNTTTHNCLSRLQGHKGEISKVSSPCPLLHPLILAPRPLIP